MITNMNQPLLSDAILIKNEFLSIKPTYSQDNKEYKQIVKELIDMGFELEMIDMCFCFFNIKSIEQAITYLTKEDGVWQHNYIESENKLCIICNEHCDHLNYNISLNNPKQIERESLNRKFNRNSVSSRSYSNPNFIFGENSEIVINFKANSDNNNIIKNDLNENLTSKAEIISIKDIVCKVCEIESPIDDTFQLDCGHVFCMECWYFYLDQKISHSEVMQINCMMKGCTKILSDDLIKTLVANNPNLFKNYEKFKKNKLIMNSCNMKFCPEVNCTGHLEKFDEKNFIECQFGHQYCFNCLKKWHEKKKCEEMVDEDFEAWKKGKFIKKCPNCKFWTEKNDGCNHMTCRACNHSWCWYCSGNYTSNHFSRWGSCYGLQFGKYVNINNLFLVNNDKYHNCCCRCLRRVAKLSGDCFLGLGMILACLLIGSSIISVLFGNNIMMYKVNECPKFFILATVAILSIVFQPLLLVLSFSLCVIGLAFFILCLPLAIYFVKRYHR